MKKATSTESQGRKTSGARGAADAAGAQGRPSDPASYARRHLRIGWWSLLVFLTLGAVLESLHGFKIGYYLDVAHETRRLMWRLAHAHGTLLSLVHIVFALTVKNLPGWSEGPRSLASRCLLAGTILLPSGFFVGGVVIHDGDPGLGIALVPIGALLLFVAVFLTARAAKSS